MSDRVDYIINKVKEKYNFSNISFNKNHTIGNSKNLILEFNFNENEYILRVSKQKEKDYKEIESEIKWLDYLKRNGASVSRPILTVDKNLLAKINFENEEFVIVLFEKAKGCLVDSNNPKEWNEELFSLWGETMGKIHSLSNSFKNEVLTVNRKQWNDNMYFSNDGYNPKNKSKIIKNRWNETIDKINSLDKSNLSYGLIHYDFHQFNFLVDKNKITVFDFDDCVFHWFICDIAIATYHAILSVPVDDENKRNQFAKIFIKNFINGYKINYQIDKDWEEKLILFLDYRMITSYTFISTLDNLNESGLKIFNWLKNRIESRQPFVNI
jgi:Ser/Thr protein kinase RdoA (MazF antagonist)